MDSVVDFEAHRMPTVYVVDMLHAAFSGERPLQICPGGAKCLRTGEHRSSTVCVGF